MHFRAIIATLACLVGAGFLGWRSMAQPVPKLSELTELQGTVDRIETGTRNSRRTSSSFPVIHLKGKEGGFKYLDWFPHPGNIWDLAPGDQIRILTDLQGDRWVWSVSKSGEAVVSYEEVAAAVRENRRFDPYLAGGLALVGLFGLFRLIKSRA